MIDNEDEAREILEHIMELAAALGWACALVQQPDGEIIGGYIGPEEWVKRRTGSADKLH